MPSSSRQCGAGERLGRLCASRAGPAAAGSRIVPACSGRPARLRGGPFRFVDGVKSDAESIEAESNGLQKSPNDSNELPAPGRLGHKLGLLACCANHACAEIAIIDCQPSCEPWHLGVEWVRASRRRLVFLVRTTRDDLQSIVCQRPLQRFRLIPWRAHPDVALLIRCQDHRHRLRVNWLDDCVRRGGEKFIDQVRAGDWLGLRVAVTLELGPDPRE